MFYLVIYILLALFGIYYYYKPESKSYNASKILVFILFVCISGLRFETGVDYFAYRRAFINSPNLFELFQYSSFEEYFYYNSYEPGYVLISSLIRLFTDEVQWLFLIVSVFCSFLLFKTLDFFIEKKIFFFSLLSYFCFVYMFMEMQATRQSIAAAIIFWSLTKFESGGIKTFLKYIVLASLLHYSALVFIPVAFFLSKELKKVTIILSLFLASLIFILRLKWIYLILSFLANYFSSFYIFERMYAYTINESMSMERSFFITIFLYVFVFFFFLFINKRQSKREFILTNMFFLYLVFTMVLWELTLFSIRTTWYLLLGFIMILPLCLNFFEKKSKPFYIIFILLFCFLPIRPFILEYPDVIPFTPYQDFFTYKLLGRKSTGLERANTYARDHFLPDVQE